MSLELISLHSSVHIAIFLRIMSIYFKLEQRETITDLTESGMVRIMGVLLLRKPLGEYTKPCLQFLFETPHNLKGES